MAFRREQIDLMHDRLPVRVDGKAINLNEWRTSLGVQMSCNARLG
jgi:hypothetical protein